MSEKGPALAGPRNEEENDLRDPRLAIHPRVRRTGLAANHSRGHIARAVLEGVAFSLKDTFSLFAEMRVPVSNVRLGGGGARSDLWRQIQADVYGYEVESLAAEEGAAYGAALLAGVGAKFWNSVDEACDAVVEVQKRIQPDPGAFEALQTQYEKYRMLYPSLKPVFARSQATGSMNS